MKKRNTKEAKRALILGKALELFAKKGYHNATTAEIAKASGIAKGTLFNYFKSKEHLLRSLIFETLADLAGLIDPNKDGIVTRDDFFGVIRESKIWIVNNSQFVSLYFSLVAQPSVFELLKTEIWIKMAPYLDNLTVFFQKEGISDAYAEVRFFLAMLDGIGIHYAMDPENFPIEKTEEKIISYYQQKIKK